MKDVNYSAALSSDKCNPLIFYWDFKHSNTQNFPLLSIHTDPGADPASYPMGNFFFLGGCEVEGACKGTMAGSYTESLVCLLGTGFNLAQVQVWL